MRFRAAATTAAITLAALVTLPGCGSAGSPATNVVTVTRPAATSLVSTAEAPAQPVDDTVTATTPAAATTSANPAAVRSSWRMPDEAGKVLQTAQDDIQALTGDGIFFTHSHDATGADRFQILDRDWKVCSQNVAPGARITADSDIVFNVVKLSETCP